MNFSGRFTANMFRAAFVRSSQNHHDHSVCYVGESVYDLPTKEIADEKPETRIDQTLLSWAGPISPAERSAPFLPRWWKKLSGWTP